MAVSVSKDDIKALRSRTGVSIAQCRDALEVAGGDMEQALAELKKKGVAVAAKKADRELNAGTVAAYVHGDGAIGALCELLCETDFVAKNAEFKALAYELAMQVAATEESILKDDNESFSAQPYIKDTNKTVADLMNEAIQKFRERIEVGRIAKFSI